VSKNNIEVNLQLEIANNLKRKNFDLRNNKN
jgi:hypothetical protein